MWKNDIPFSNLVSANFHILSLSHLSTLNVWKAKQLKTALTTHFFIYSHE